MTMPPACPVLIPPMAPPLHTTRKGHLIVQDRRAPKSLRGKRGRTLNQAPKSPKRKSMHCHNLISTIMQVCVGFVYFVSEVLERKEVRQRKGQWLGPHTAAGLDSNTSS